MHGSGSPFIAGTRRYEHRASKEIGGISPRALEKLSITERIEQAKGFAVTVVRFVIEDYDYNYFICSQ